MIGIIAGEFPPTIGGMQRHAWGLAQALHAIEPVVVFTPADIPAAELGANFAIRPSLMINVRVDRGVLETPGIDRWLVLNAGYAELADRADRPVHIYAHGLDFLDPWIGNEPRLVRGACRILRRVPGGGRTAGGWRRDLRRRGVERGLRRARCIFANSAFTAARLRDAYPRLATPIVVNHPGVDDAFLAPLKPSRGRRDGALHLVIVARLGQGVAARRKNVDGLLHAMALLRGELACTLDVVGDGELRPELEALSRALGIAAQVRFRGWLTQDALIETLDDADMFVMPAKGSADNVEGFGIVYIEAAARGVPSLASRAGGATDAIVDGRTGIVLDDADPPAIVEGLRRFVAMREQLGDRVALRRFAETFRWQRVAGELHRALS